MLPPVLLAAFPDLASDDPVVTHPPDPRFNCVAWAVGVADALWWPADPDGYWPPGVPDGLIVAPNKLRRWTPPHRFLKAVPLPHNAPLQSLVVRRGSRRGEHMTPDDLVGAFQSAPDPPALAGLSAVDWSAVSHAHGPATDVPALLRAAVSGDPDQRDFAWQLLFETVWHQGTVYAATAVVVPFLYNLLEADGVPDKASAAMLLAAIADGHSYLECHATTPESVAIHERIAAQSGSTLAADLARERGHVESAQRAVASRLDVLYPYLRDPEPEIRRSVAVAVGCFADIVDRLLPDLEAAHRDEPDESARAALAEVIERRASRGRGPAAS